MTSYDPKDQAHDMFVVIITAVLNMKLFCFSQRIVVDFDRYVHGNGIPSRNGDTMRMGKNTTSRGNLNGNGKLHGNGNYPHSRGN